MMTERSCSSACVQQYYPKMRLVIDGKEFEVSLGREGDDYVVEVGDRIITVALGHPSKVIDDGMFITQVESGGGNHFGVQVDNDFFDVMLVSNVASMQDNITAPLRGVVTDVLVKNGMRVKKGQVFLKVLSMKMENELAASRSCIVRKIHVKKGQTVDKGDILVETQ